MYMCTLFTAISTGEHTYTARIGLTVVVYESYVSSSDGTKQYIIILYIRINALTLHLMVTSHH